jgi:hypothetical protein
MNSHVAEKSIIHSKGEKKTGAGHSYSSTDHGVHGRGKLLPRQKHVSLHNQGIQPNGDPEEVMLWGDL